MSTASQRDPHAPHHQRRCLSCDIASKHLASQFAGFFSSSVELLVPCELSPVVCFSGRKAGGSVRSVTPLFLVPLSPRAELVYSPFAALPRLPETQIALQLHFLHQPCIPAAAFNSYLPALPNMERHIFELLLLGSSTPKSTLRLTSGFGK